MMRASVAFGALFLDLDFCEDSSSCKFRIYVLVCLCILLI